MGEASICMAYVPVCVCVRLCVSVCGCVRLCAVVCGCMYVGTNIWCSLACAVKV